jgi:hypothetical protein
VGGVAFFYQFGQTTWLGRTPLVWGTTLAVIVPISATIAIPRRFGVSLLVGWIWGATALVVLYYVFIEDALSDTGTGPIVVFAGTLFALLLVVIPFARSAYPTIRPHPEHSVSAIDDRPS